jgi:ribosomal protein S18 acetylase RimI-like enzyme
MPSRGDQESMRSNIREYQPECDAQGVRECFIELQNFERSLEPELPEGHVTADAYLAAMFAHGEESAGKVFVAEVDGAVIGFVSVWAKVRPTEPGEPPIEYAYISDLVVLPAYRGHRLGHALMQRAEEYVSEQGTTIVKIGVLAKNTGAKQLYNELGFTDYHVQLVKRLPKEPTSSS